MMLDNMRPRIIMQFPAQADPPCGEQNQGENGLDHEAPGSTHDDDGAREDPTGAPPDAPESGFRQAVRGRDPSIEIRPIPPRRPTRAR